MAGKVEDVYQTVPYPAASKRLADGNELHERRFAAVHEFHGFPEPIVGHG
jgi:hypothetical protein